MKLPEWFIRRVLAAAKRRPCDEFVGPRDDVYLRRWFLLPKNRLCNVYLHQFLRSDDDRALHDHPWPSVSFLLRGELVEVRFRDPRQGEAGGLAERWLRPGAVTWRGASLAHRIELPRVVMRPMSRRPGYEHWPFFEPCRQRDAWTLFITGPHLRQWGFHCPRGWVPWRRFTAPGQGGAGSVIGRGCD